MEVFLYNSTVCRLCGEENDNGNLLYSTEENDQNLSQIINTYLPITVTDDGHLPRTICPGCTIQLEASVEFLNLIINGQKVLRELYEREKEYKKSYTSSNEPEIITEKIIYEINAGNKVYQLEHPISLQVAGLEKPKRKRGRPPKIQKSPEELAEKDALKEQERNKVENNDSDGTGKRRRKTPTRFKEVVQGKELERIFKEEGMTDGEDSDSEKKVIVEEAPVVPEVKEPQVIGHLEQSGELVVVLKGKGRGRPKGRLRQTREQCMICGMEFSSTGRYMSHIAQHGPVLYQCADCSETFATRLRFCEHQARSAHRGQNILQCKDLTSAKENKRLKSGKSEKIVEQVVETTTVTDMVTVVDVDSIVSGDTPVPDVSPDMDVVTVVTTEESNKDEDGKVEETEEIVQESNPIALKKVGEPVGEVKTKLKCNHCDKEFSSRQAKSMHNKAVHQGEKPYQCGECGAAFGYPRSLALHRVSHRRHRRARGFACDLCGKVLSHPSSVVYHKQSAHAEQRYVCGTCGKHFRHKQLLQRHQLVHSQLRPFRCKLCNSSFKTKANLANHQMLHSGVKKFSCEICKQKFSHKTSHTLHMRWHTGVKPFECGVCGKSFSQKGNLSEHERIHTGEKPYQCALCSRRFTTSSQHRLHLRRHAPDRDSAACPHCAYRMPSRGINGEATPEGVEERCPSCGRTPTERPPPRTQQRHLRRIAPAPASKQISLLVSESDKMTTGSGVQTEMDARLAEGLDAGLQEGLDAGLDAELREDDENVVYIAYHLDEPSTSMHFNQPEELYTPALPAELPALPALHHQREHLPVTDEQGNLLHFTMQDGTRLAITSPDGECLQVVMQDGQTIPVEINGFDDEKDLLGPETVVHQLNLQKSGDSKALPHYYTLV